ncbi:hypothetical protein NF867_05580 [Solitalea sp. MAHUQ-68]|uniref:Outer membrane protein beta-barrel domain-containing protein n=1 Tax=Solitalea agri TaxID=2953739 RepID=A0A9X2JEF3_9SPHI|nr:hypothetical protein [Solitalea agri]MCO4292331.1 hypothetical protein [Solitalea agri]
MFNTKPTIALLLLLSISFLTKAQEISPYKFSLGIKALSYTQRMPVPNSDYDNNDYVLNYPSALIFKVRSNLFLWRSTIEYNRFKDDNSNPECSTCPKTTGKYETFKVGGGFEKEFYYSNVRPVLGLDLFYYRSDYNGNLSVGSSEETLQTNTRNGAGFSPFVGIKIFPVDFIAITATTSFDGILYHEGIKSEMLSTGVKTTTPGKYHYDTMFNPVAGLSITYNFGTQD